MKRSSVEKVLKAEGHYTGDLVSLDFKSENLQKFLESVVHAVNQHTQRINLLEMEKITTEEVTRTNQQMLKASLLSPVVLKELGATASTSQPDSNSEVVEGIGANLAQHSEAFQHLFSSLDKKEQQIRIMESKLNSLETTERSRQQLKKNAQACKRYSDDENTKTLSRFKELEMNCNKKLSEFENITKDLQKKTLWKINECENALLKKITPDYVEKAMEHMQTKILNEVENGKNQKMNDLKFNLDTLKTKANTMERDIEDHEKENKELFHQLFEECKAYENKEKVDSNKLEMDLKLKELAFKIDKLEKREDPKSIEFQLTEQLTQLKQKTNSQYQKMNKLDTDFYALKDLLDSFSGADGKGFDPHRMCQLDGQVNMLRDANRLNESKLASLDEDTKIKLVAFQERVMTTLSMLKNQDNFVNREELYESMNRLREPVSQKLNENQNLMQELNGKLNKMESFEKAVKKKIKELTRGEDLNKILDTKMNQDQGQAQFSSLTMKIENMEVIFHKLRMELDANADFMKMLHDHANSTEEGVNVLGPKKRVYPAKCLGCGQKHIPTIYDNNMMQGSDGKYYRCDTKGSYTFDPNEVFGVSTNQASGLEPVLKKKVVGRASNGTLRPSSAQRH